MSMKIFDERFCHPVTLGNVELRNLLYGDYLILISETRTGLKCCLDNLIMLIIKKDKSNDSK